MSRDRSFMYLIEPRTPRIIDLWEELMIKCEAHAPIAPHCVFQGGASVPEYVDVWLYCNKTKARKIKDRLDTYFGREGRLLDEAEIDIWLED